ncbi:hypothetical protein DNFV4_02963 [Nitrospira tepida]|uniref:Uncharacterized protein n=1 Tax=Nitrospira tepida TaxID=2973512 RepID=A0AA86N0L7_9BACT|nr:hypothetical protein [Nitrospira tepida]CAI4032533.1 hypothetical protein DNFV4_02963 [Nitrospira tepida]
MKRVMFALLLAMAIAPSAWAQSWPNEPAGSTVINDYNWNSCPGGGWQPAYGCGSIKSDSTAPHSPNSVLSFTYNPSIGGGGGDPYIQVNNLSEWYTGFWVWMDPNFVGTASQTNKIVAFIQSDGSYFWLEAGAYCDYCYGGPFKPHWALSTRPNQPYLNNCHLPGYGDCPGTLSLPSPTGTTITKGVWHRMEVYAKKSTSDTSRDGILRWWMDGVQQGYLTNVNFGGALAMINFTPAWAPFKEEHWTHPSEWRFDHVRVSAPGGGGSAPKGDTTPPSSPVNLRAQ